MSSFITFLVVVGIFGAFFGKGFFRTIGGILSAIAGVILFGGLILAQLIASGIIRMILSGIVLLIILIVFIVWHSYRRRQRRCRYECYRCPHRHRCHLSHY